MIYDNPSVADRLAAAYNSSDLALSDLKIKDADYLIALGWTGVHHRVVTALMRLHYGLRPEDYPAALAEVATMVRRLNKRYNWRIPGREAERKLAKECLDFALCPVCPACKGRRYELQPGAPMLSDRICQACAGTGTQRVRTKFLPDVLTEMQRLESVVCSGVAKRLHGRDVANR